MSTTPATPLQQRPWRIFASGPFRSLWAAQLLSLLGESFTYVAMPWLVLQITHSGLAVGSVLALEAVPRAAFMLVGGAVADRLSPRLTMLGSAVVRAAVLGGLAALILAQRVQLWEVYAAAVAVGAVSAFFMPARFAVVPSVVADHHLEAGNALLTLNQQGSMVLGPAVAGVLIATTSTGLAFAGDAVAFALAALLLLALSTAPRLGAQDQPASPPGSLLRTMADGLAYVWNDVGLRAVIALIAVIDFCYAGAMQVGLPVLAQERFSQGAAAFGSVVAAFGAGATIGVIGSGLARVPPRMGRLAIGVVTWLGAGLGLLGLAPNLSLAVVVAAVSGLATGAGNTFGLTWLHRRTDDAMRGRVAALVFLASVGLAPLSLALAGLLAAHHVGLIFGAGAAMILVAALGAALSKTVRSL